MFKLFERRDKAPTEKEVVIQDDVPCRTYYISTHKGFVQDAVRAHAKWVHWRFTHDPRMATTFSSFEEADDYMKKHDYTLHYAIFTPAFK